MSDEVLDPAHMDDGGLPAAPAAPPTPAPEPKVSDDGNVMEVGGRKYVTFDALTAERAQRQQLAQTVAQLEPLMPEFEQFLTKRNERQTATTAASGKGGDDEAYLREVAETLHFYDENHEPDLRRAQGHLNIMRRESDRSAQRAVEPVAQSTAREMARVNRERANTSRFVDGKPIADSKYMSAAMDAVGAEHLADPNVANMVQVVAAGLEYLDARKNGTLSRGRGGREPLHLEGSRGRFDGDGEGGLSAMDLAAARARGKSPEEWAKMRNSVTSEKRGNTLEDI